MKSQKLQIVKRLLHGIGRCFFIKIATSVLHPFRVTPHTHTHMHTGKFSGFLNWILLLNDCVLFLLVVFTIILLFSFRVGHMTCSFCWSFSERFRKKCSPRDPSGKSNKMPNQVTDQRTDLLANLIRWIFSPLIRSEPCH